ncbi:MAG: ABC transporter ATP-binding protein [Acidimicrobiales bacterium]
MTVNANPVSGSLLVTFDPNIDVHSIELVVGTVLASLEDDWPVESPSSPLRRMVEVALPDRRDLVRPALSTIGAHSLNLAQGLSIISMVTVAAGEVSPTLSKLGFTTSGSQLAALGAGGLALTVAEAWAQHTRVKAWRTISSRAEDRLRNEVFVQLERQDIDFFGEHGTGPLLNALTEYVQNIATLIGGGDNLVEHALTVTVATAALFKASPTVAIIAVAAVPLIIIPARVLGPRTASGYARLAETTSRLTQAIEGILTGIVEVKSFTAEKQEATRVCQLSTEAAEESVSAASTAFLQSTITRNILFGTSAVGTWYTARMTWGAKVAQGQLTRVVFWIPKMMGAFCATIESSGIYYRAVSAAAKLREILEATPEITDGADRFGPEDNVGDISIDNVSFGYDPSRPVLRGISLYIRAGQTLGVVGRTGSGKSTLVRLLMRFYDTDSGEIRIGGHDIRRLGLAELRAAVSMVSQDVYLFDDSLEHNLRYGWSQASEADLVAALRAAGAAELLTVLPEGLHTRVGERGQRLSGGQRQRVALARALLKPAPILIVDEATSNLDYETEAAVRSSLREATQGRTVIIVAHRLTSVRHADSIVVLDQGRFVEQGSHGDLLAQRGLYYHLWQLQSG